MWNEINNGSDLMHFMNLMGSFHDSCIKEMKYVSGAYVDDDLSMYPVNDCRILKVIIQRQYRDNPMIEMEFWGLKRLQLQPWDDQYTCEIQDATMEFKDDLIFWCDGGEVSEMDLGKYDGTMICAAKLRWRSIDNCMGPDDFFPSRA